MHTYLLRLGITLTNVTAVEFISSHRHSKQVNITEEKKNLGKKKQIKDPYFPHLRAFGIASSSQDPEQDSPFG